jgi:hypothetical protein
VPGKGEFDNYQILAVGLPSLRSGVLSPGKKPLRRSLKKSLARETGESQVDRAGEIPPVMPVIISHTGV